MYEPNIKSFNLDSLEPESTRFMRRLKHKQYWAERKTEEGYQHIESSIVSLATEYLGLYQIEEKPGW